ncbi:MAG: ABC-three component system middle component 5 [Candidatus Electrothrix sp. GW3-4]|uniref:ABC-three component system middle component 5 n=1 Tax=Candidatus Electrothrix sp. GW3-4 TaxID=3126740 RepID=UPI0030CF06D2
MLLYHPATDFYHCWMRFASILCECGHKGTEFDRIRILDFLLCFPHEIRKCKLPREDSAELRRKIKQLPETYEDPQSIRQAFLPMTKIHKQVTMDMVARGIIQRKKYQEGTLILNIEEAHAYDFITSVAEEWKIRNEEWHEKLINVVLSIPLNGRGGLKDRTGLLEFRYDG